MTTEEKAKAYDEALTKGSRLWECGEITRESYEYLFPELKESEDERIKNAIRYAIGQSKHSDSTLINGVSSEEALAWLENQGENNKWKPSKDEMDALYGLTYITDEIDDKTDEAITKLYQDLKREFFGGASYENMFHSTPVDAPIKFEKQCVQKSADKVEPEFKVGDTIHYKEEDTIFPMIIEKISGGYYVCDGGERVNINFQDYYELVKQASTWSEKDAIKLKTTITLLNNPNVIEDNKELRDKTVDWLQSLKNRVQPQHKPVCNEEDEEIKHDIELCIEFFLKDGSVIAPGRNTTKEEALDWLKSLIPKNAITDEELVQAKKQAYNDVLDKIEYHSGEPTFDDGWSAAIWYLKNKNAIPKNTCKPSDLPHWKKSTLPNDNTTGFNSDYFCHKGYSINYKELFEKLPKDD